MLVNLENQKLWFELEQLREHLYGVVDKKGLSSPEAIHASEIMDNKLNEYYRLYG